MADTSLNEDRLSILIWQISNLWQSKIRQRLKNSNITFNEYIILETLYKLEKIKDNITQQEICKNSSIDRSVVSLKITNLEKKFFLTEFSILSVGNMYHISSKMIFIYLSFRLKNISIDLYYSNRFFLDTKNRYDKVTRFWREW